MSNLRQDVLFSVVSEVLRPEGFAKRGSSWFRKSDEVVEVVNLQRSQFGPQYYLNLGLWLRLCGDDPALNESKCHIRLRVEDCLPSTGAEGRWATLLNLESEHADETRKAELRGLISEQLVPFADACRAVSGIRMFYAQGRFKKGLVRSEMRTMLENDGLAP